MTATSTKKVKASQGNYSKNGSVPLVSVIIPSFNHAHYLSDAIGSVLLQTYGTHEIVVVDDGSTDNTGEVAAEFGDQIRYIWQENKGLSAARNSGIKAARGDLIGLLDADDMYESDFLETLVSILQSDPGIDGVYCSARVVDEENNSLPQLIGKSIPPEEFRDTLLKGGFFPPLCMFAHKYCYEEQGFFDSAFQGCADWDMWLRMSDQYNIVGIDRVLVRYRVSPGSMSRDPIHMLDDRTRVLSKYFADEATDSSNWTPTHRQAVAYSCIRATIEFLQTGDREQGYENLKKAFITYPEMSKDYEVFYLLSLGNQPMGFRTDYEPLKTDVNATLLMAMMDQLFIDPEVAVRIKDYRRTAYANAFTALGQLSYNKHNFSKARKYLLRAMAINPRNAVNQRTTTMLAKSLLPSQLIAFLKSRRENLANGFL